MTTISGRGGGSDAEEGAREWRELTRIVDQIFARPGDLEPAVPGHLRRAALQLAEKPSFGNYRLWVVWGPADLAEETVPIRRLVWRRDIDGNRGDPMARLRRLGSELVPTIEVNTSEVRLSDINDWIDTVPVVDGTAESIGNPRSLSLDGNRCSVTLEAGDSAWRHDWLAIGTDWQPTNPMYEELAAWAMGLRQQFEAVFG